MCDVGLCDIEREREGRGSLLMREREKKEIVGGIPSCPVFSIQIWYTVCPRSSYIVSYFINWVTTYYLHIVLTTARYNYHRVVHWRFWGHMIVSQDFYI